MSEVLNSKSWGRKVNERLQADRNATLTSVISELQNEGVYKEGTEPKQKEPKK